MKTWLVILGYSVVVIFDMLPLFRICKRKEKLLYTSILVVTFVISIILSLDIKIPSPIPFYRRLIKLE